MRGRAILVRGSRGAIAAAFPLLAELQPVAWVAEGLVVVPSLAADRVSAERALSRCPLPTAPAPAPTLAIWPDPPAAWYGGIYRRSPGHAAAPAGVHEIVQCPGNGFGPGDHSTTAMCLELLGALPRADAVDIGCGSGLLAMAWARLDKGAVLAIDPDPDATRQARASIHASGLGQAIEIRSARVESLTDDELAGRVLLANVPATVHRQLQLRIQSAPPAALVSGLRRGEGAEIVDGYRRHGMRRVGSARRGRWECHVLLRDTHA